MKTKAKNVCAPSVSRTKPRVLSMVNTKKRRPIGKTLSTRHTSKTRITLKPHQMKGLGFLNMTNDDVCVELPTGSGKTVIMVAFARMELSRRKGNVLIATPMEHIEHAFTKRFYDQIGEPKQPGLASCTYMVPESFIVASRDNSGTNGETITDYLEAPRDYALACTHSALQHVNLPKRLDGSTLLVDEAQYAGAPELAKFIQAWRERGGRLVFFTATAFRPDEKPVVLDGMRIFRLSLGQAKAEGWAPKNLSVRIVPLLSKDVTVERFRGEASPSSGMALTVSKAMCETWLADGRPPTIVHIPSMRGGSGHFVERVIADFRKIGARVFDASGVGDDKKRGLIDLLNRERTLSYGERTVDVIVGIQRTHTGTDWPICSAVYCYGLPASQSKIIQLIGRGERPKDGDHPFKDLTVARFFVETVDDETCDILDKKSSRDALAICCLLGDMESPATWDIERALTSAIEAEADDERHEQDMQAELAGGGCPSSQLRTRSGPHNDCRNARERSSDGRGSRRPADQLSAR